MELKTYFAQDRNGNIIPNANVAIYLTGTNTLVSGLTNVSGAQLSNPFTATADGKIQFHAPDGIYDMVVSVGDTSGARVTFQCVDIGQQLSGANSAAERAEAAAQSVEETAAKLEQLSQPDGVKIVGGSTLLVNTFIDAINETGVVSELMVTRGHSAPGVGSASYAKDGTTGPASTGDQTKFYDADGVGWAMVPTSSVNYSQFGAVLDGVNDDTQAIIRAHTFANANGLAVSQSGGMAFVRLDAGNNKQIQMKGNCEYTGGFRFVTDSIIGRGFVVLPDSSDVMTLSQSDVTISDFAQNKMRIPSLASYANYFAVILSSEVDLNRKRDSGTAYQVKKQPVIIGRWGSLNAPLWCTFNSIDSIMLQSMTSKTVEIKGFHLETTGDIEKVSPFGVQRNNTNIVDFRYTHKNTTKQIPVQSLVSVEFACNVLINGISCDALSEGILDYNYVINTWCSSNIIVERMTSFDGWAQIDGNYCRGVTVRDSEIDRVGSHYRGFDYTFENLNARRSRCIEVSGGGRLDVRNIKVKAEVSNMQMVVVGIRGDYGAEWDGDILVDGVTFDVTAFDNTTTGQTINIVSALIDSSVGAHDFMRTVALPRSITVKNCAFLTSGIKNSNFRAIAVGCTSAIISGVLYPTNIVVDNVTLDNRNGADRFKVKALDLLANTKEAAQVQYLDITVSGVKNVDPARFSETVLDESSPTVYIVTTGNNLKVTGNIYGCPWLTIYAAGNNIDLKVSRCSIPYFNGTNGANTGIYFFNCDFFGTRFRGTILVRIISCFFRKYTDYTGAVLNIGNGQNVDTNIKAIRDTHTDVGVTINGTQVTAATAKSGYADTAYYQ